MTAGEKAIRYSTIGAVSVIALVAAFVSYRHALQVVTEHGESGTLAKAYPLTIDGLIFAASMVLLDAARRGDPAHWLARGALGLGITATVAANVAAGINSGMIGAIVAAWPALALVISYELLMLVLRGSVSAPVPGDAPASAPGAAPASEVHLPETGVPEPVPADPGVPDALRDAADAFAAELAAGDVPSIRAIRAELHIGQDKARQVRAHLETLTPAGASIARLRGELRQDAALARQ